MHVVVIYFLVHQDVRVSDILSSPIRLFVYIHLFPSCRNSPRSQMSGVMVFFCGRSSHMVVNLTPRWYVAPVYGIIGVCLCLCVSTNNFNSHKLSLYILLLNLDNQTTNSQSGKLTNCLLSGFMVWTVSWPCAITASQPDSRRQQMYISKNRPNALYLQSIVFQIIIYFLFFVFLILRKITL